MKFIITILIGFIIGLIARFFKPGNDKMGFFLTSILGIAGAFVASFAGQVLGWYQIGQPAGFIASVLGAIVLLTIVQYIKK